jgi:hypothetical protein
VTGYYIKLHKEELNNLYSVTNIVWAMKSRKVGGAEYEMHMGGMINS